MNWIKSFVINGLLILVSIAVTLVVVDVLLHYTPMKWRYMYPLNVQGEYFVWNPALGFDIAPNFGTTTHSFAELSYPVWSNDIGCYDYPYDGQSPYIYVAGDSFTWGYTPLDEKWSKVVERSTGTRTMNCGVPGYGTRQEVIKAQRDIEHLSRPPALIVVAHYENDAADDAMFPSSTAYHGYVVPSWLYCDSQFMFATSPLVATTTCNVSKPDFPVLKKIKTELAARSVLYLMAKRQFGIPDKLRRTLMGIAPNWLLRNGLAYENQSWFENGSAILDDTRYWDIHFKNVQAFKTLADTVHSKLVVVFIPQRESVMATSTRSQSANERTERYLRQHGIAYIDLLQVLREVDPSATVLYWPNDVHWTPAGNALAGSIIGEYIKRQGLLSP
ncbi:MAG: hypothetical protein UY89_C0001G0005 [Parcubacteria group bacterium GW2011_GWA1_54_9]|nr:MAG: hypothetical protein UY89_C0001G0005 [Parcubacteria group bacterium GW2011_GWA1_54_9]KKW42642.1 MAG: hypothetical protein UY91_C0002G0008 [Parcubacteria group bacterium GW2011_GWB1_55_9]